MGEYKIGKMELLPQTENIFLVYKDGWHNPEASHLLLVESVAGAELTQRAYDAAVAERYLWHEFGDSCLLLP